MFVFSLIRQVYTKLLIFFLIRKVLALTRKFLVLQRVRQIVGLLRRKLWIFLLTDNGGVDVSISTKIVEFSFVSELWLRDVSVSLRRKL